VHARRLERNHLLGPAARERLVEVVRDVCGIHAQVTTAADLALGARVDGLTRKDVTRELWEERSLVKVSSLRTTLHLHPADELPLWMAASRLRLPTGNAGLPPEQEEAVVRAVAEALDGRNLTTDELGDEIGRRAGAWALKETEVIHFGKPAITWKLAWGEAFKRGLACYGPPRGQRVTFARADQWLGGWEEIDPAEALSEVLRRYLRAYGPARPEDFKHWFYAEAPFDSVALEEVDVQGYRAWVLAGDTDWPEPPRTVRLLPYYDCYVIGCHPRDRFIPGEHRTRVFDRGAGPFPTLVVDGVVAGTWRHEKHGKRVEIHVEPFGRLTAAGRRAVDEEIARVSAFLG
jgi:hypothetical protein